MQVSATPSELRRGACERPDVLARTWVSPLLRLQRSGDGRVWLKREGTGPSGSFFDRVVRLRFERAAPASIVVPAADSFAYAVALRAVPLGVPVQVVADAGDAKRLRTLLAGAGARVRACRSPDEHASRVAAALDGDGAVLWTRDNDARSLLDAYAELAREVRAGLGSPASTWVVPGYGLATETLRRALGAHSGARVVAVDDDGERRRVLDGSAACRRQQVAHREGVLLSPMGAEVVDAAIGLADETSGAVVAVVPEDGRRFTGWW